MTSDFWLQSSSPAETEQIASTLVDFLPRRCVVGLSGPLGAGKTCFVRGLAMGLEIDPETVSSPTFVFCHEYHGTRLLYHFDAYRLKSEEEFLQLGVEELFDSDAICVVEWADRICGCLPKEMLEVEIETHLECSDVSPRSVVAEPLLSKPTSALSNCRTIHFRGHGIDLLGFQTRSSGQVPPE